MPNATLEPLAKLLSRLVVEALVQAGFTQDDVLSGGIEFTNLPWQVPPLVIDAPMFGIPLSEYIDRAVYVNTEALTELWSDALLNMKNKPDKVLTFEGYRAASRAIPNVRLNERPMYLSPPEGFPAGITDLAATMLSLECAHLLRRNSRISSFTADDDNYFAELPEGIEVGIKEGLPALYFDIWDIPVTGMVEEMLRTPRGTIFEGCDWNITSKVRSLVYTYQKSFRDYEALDWAIQALRAIEGDRELLQAVRDIRKVAYNRRVRLDALAQAVQVVDSIAMTDRQRIDTLKNLLVPEVISSAQFSRTIYPVNATPPAVLMDKVLERIRVAVKQLHHEEESLYATHGKPERSV